MNLNIVDVRKLKLIARKLLGSRSSFFVSVYIKKIKNRYFDVLIYMGCDLNIKVGSYECKTLHFLDETSPLTCLAGSELGVNKSPEYIGGEFEVLSRRVPEVNLYKLKNCIFTINSSNFISDEVLFVERIKDLSISVSDYSSGILRRHNEVYGLINRNNKLKFLEFESAYFLGGNGSSNYYHWMTEILPKLKYIATESGYDRCQNLVVSSKVLIADAFKKTIKSAIADLDFKVYFIESGDICHIDNLYLVSNPSNVLFNSKSESPKITFSYLRKSSMDYVRSIGLELIDRNDSKQRSDKVFIARREGSARSYNQNEIESMLVKEFGFKVIYFDGLSIEEQINIFSSARFIVGPSGAAWTNLIFCNQDVTLVSWLPTNAKEFSVYSSMAFNYGLKMVFLESIPDVKDQLHTSYTVSLDELRNCIYCLIYEGKEV